MRLIEPGKPDQNACIESFNGWLRDECLNEYWFLNLDYAHAVIEGRRGRADCPMINSDLRPRSACC